MNVYGSGVSYLSTSASSGALVETFLKRSKDASTSAEVISWPLLNLTPLRSVKVKVFASLLMSTLEASIGLAL